MFIEKEEEYSNPKYSDVKYVPLVISSRHYQEDLLYWSNVKTKYEMRGILQEHGKKLLQEGAKYYSKSKINFHC